MRETIGVMQLSHQAKMVHNSNLCPRMRSTNDFEAKIIINTMLLLLVSMIFKTLDKGELVYKLHII